jgi:hypothetical protein
VHCQCGLDRVREFGFASNEISHDRIAHALNSASAEQESAAHELRRRLRPGMDARLADAFPALSDLTEAEKQKMRGALLSLMCKIGASARNASIGAVMNAAILELSELRT